MKRAIQIIGVLCIAIAVQSCGGGVQEDPTKGMKILKYNEAAGISSLDPAYAERFEDIWAMSQLYNGLVRMGSDLQVKPDLAEEYEVSDDGLMYTFHLRNDVYFHPHDVFPTGGRRTVNAYDVVYSFSRIIDPETASQGKFIFSDLLVNEGTDNLGIKALNDSTVRMWLERPNQAFLYQLTLPYCFIVPEEVVNHYQKDFRRNPVGTGPFKFKVWHEGRQLVFIKNKDYWETDEEGNKLPYIDAVSISFMKSRHTEFVNFTKGDLDFMSGIHESYRKELLMPDGTLNPEYAEQVYLQKHPWLKTDYIGILVDPDIQELKDSPLRVKAFRKALNHLIDREGLVRYVRSGIGVPAKSGFVPHQMNDYNDNPIVGYSYDPDKAKALLFEAGFEDPDSYPEITLITTDPYKHYCEFIVSKMREHGVNVNMEIVLPASQQQMVAHQKAHFFRKSWTCDYPDPINFLQLFYGDNFAPEYGPNYTHFNDFYYDKWFEQAEVETNDSTRQELFRKMEETIKDEAPVIPLFYDEVVRFISKDVQGLESNAMNQLDLKRVRIDRGEEAE